MKINMYTFFPCVSKVKICESEEISMTKKHSEVAVPCPWCGQGKTLANKSADIRVSCPCIACGRFYEIDFQTMRTTKLKQKPRKAITKNDKK